MNRRVNGWPRHNKSQRYVRNTGKAVILSFAAP